MCVCACAHVCVYAPVRYACVLSVNIAAAPFQKKQTNLVNCWSSRGVLLKRINSEFCLSPPNKDFMSFVCCFGKDLEPPMLKSCIFNSPQASKTNCQRQASIYKHTNCLQSRVCLFYRHQTWRLHTGRRAGGEQS